MPICNRSKIRPDVLKLIDDFVKHQTEGVMGYLPTLGSQAMTFGALYPKVISGNEIFFKTKGTEADIYSYFTKEEMILLAKVFRYGFDYAANVDQKTYPIPKNVKVEKIDAGGVPAEWQTAPDAKKNRVLLYFHGGGMVLGSPNSHRLFTVALGQLTKMRVLSLDYRLAPEHAYPSQLEDCIAAYKWLLSKGIKPENIVIAGDSAGGSLTLMTLLKLRNDGIPLPVGAVSLSPDTDWSGSDELFWKNAETDPVLADIGLFWWVPAYLAGADPNDPMISPLFADLEGLPPLLVQASTSEMLYGGAKRFADRAKEAGVDVTFETWDGMPHVWQSFGLEVLPEAKQATAKIGEFIQKLFESKTIQIEQ
ncbi:MAG: alpha/beta hydrolase [Candidatus Freyarchaeum deiterrae]